MAVSVSLVAIALPIVSRESMYVLTHRRVKILFALAVLVVVCVLRFVLEEFSN